MVFWDDIDRINDRGKIKAKTYPSQNETKKASELNDVDAHNLLKEEILALEKNVDIVILTAVEDEYKAVCNVFSPKLIEQYENGYKYSIFSLKSVDKHMTVAVFRQNEMGMVYASLTATKAINKCNPQIVLMCGVCAGIEGKTNLGDLVVFSPVYDYGSGKYVSGVFMPDFRQCRIDERLRSIVEQMIDDDNLIRQIKDSWQHNIGNPETELRIHIYPSGSGAAVITDDIVINEIKSHQRTIGAIDMESYAIAEVARTTSLPWLIVKGVQDFANPLKNDTYREYSAHVSSMFLKAFLEKFFEMNFSTL